MTDNQKLRSIAIDDEINEENYQLAHMNPHNTSEVMWSFHGVTCTQAQSDKWRAHLNLGVCPWCSKPIQKRYDNQNKHLRICQQKPQ